MSCHCESYYSYICSECRPKPKAPTDAETQKLQELAREAVRKFEALPADEQKRLRRLQAIDWAWGELCIKYDGAPPITRERIGQIYDESH